MRRQLLVLGAISLLAATVSLSQVKTGADLLFEKPARLGSLAGIDERRGSPGRDVDPPVYRAGARIRVGGIGAAVELRPLILLPPRDWLYARCDERFAQMIDQTGQLFLDCLHKDFTRSHPLICQPDPNDPSVTRVL